MDTTKKKSSNFRPIVGIAFISLVLCGLLFPLLITGLGQALFPYQANGELVTLNGCTVGSNLIAQNFNQSAYFHQRAANQSASGVDPDITLQDAYAQIPRIHEATGIPSNELKSVVDQNVEGVVWIFGSTYVNVLRINVALITGYPQAYDKLLPPSVQPSDCMNATRTG